MFVSSARRYLMRGREGGCGWFRWHRGCIRLVGLVVWKLVARV